MFHFTKAVRRPQSVTAKNNLFKMESKHHTFLEKAQTSLQTILNERKSILRPDITKEAVKEALDRLIYIWKDLQVETFETKDFEQALECQKIFLTLSLVYLVEYPWDISKEIEEDTTGKNESSHISEFFEVELDRLCTILESIQSDPNINVIKSISLTRRLKQQILIISLIQHSHSNSISPRFEQVVCSISREDLYSALTKIVPRAYNYNLYMKYYHLFLQTFVMSLSAPKLKSAMVSALSCVEKQFPQFKLSFEKRHRTVMKGLGMETFSLEDCCDRIETRAGVLANEGPLDASQKMVNLWLLLDVSRFLTFDDNLMAIYVFSSDLPVFHEQLMRIFYVINRIDETVREVGYLAYATSKFITRYKLVYTEMHSLFKKLVRALGKNYEIYELESDSQSGAIRFKPEPSALISSKLNELCIHFSCPLACLDSIIRLSLEQSDIPILFGDEEEKFVFTAQVQSLLVLHDFIAGDREKFAEFMVELYPCLDRHFSRFHMSKSKLNDSQGPNTALPPSYHLFATSKPPTYANIDIPVMSPPITDEVYEEPHCALIICKWLAPISGFIFVLLTLLAISLYLFN